MSLNIPQTGVNSTCVWDNFPQMTTYLEDGYGEINCSVKNMSSRETVKLTDVFLWRSMAQRNELYQALAPHEVLRMDSLSISTFSWDLLTKVYLSLKVRKYIQYFYYMSMCSCLYKCDWCFLSYWIIQCCNCLYSPSVVGWEGKYNRKW